MVKKKEYRPRPELIKHFAEARRYLEQFAIYGINSREDFQKSFNISERSFQLIWKKTTKWLEKATFAIPTEESLVKKNAGRRIISADSREFSNNPLYNVFRMKSFTDNDLALYFVIMDCLTVRYYSGEENYADFDEIKDYIDDVLEYSPEFATISSKLEEYCNLGIIQKGNKDKKTVYYIANPPDFYGWENALFFYSEMYPLGIIGHYINCFHQREETSPFFYKHHYFFPALASQIMYGLVNAINSRKEVFLIINRNYMKKGKPEEEKINALPIKFYIGTRSGREYLLYRDCKDGEFKFVRLDHIEGINEIALSKNYDKYKANAADFEKYAWGVSNSEEQKKYNFQMELQINNDEKYVLRRLKRERRNGQVKQTGKNTYLYSVDAYDCGEMVPWVLTFICRIKKITCTQPEVVNKINSYIMESCKKYEVSGNEQK